MICNQRLVRGASGGSKNKRLLWKTALYLLTHEHLREKPGTENGLYVTDFSFIRVFVIIIENTSSVLVSASGVCPLRYCRGFPPVGSFLPPCGSLFVCRLYKEIILLRPEVTLSVPSTFTQYPMLRISGNSFHSHQKSST